ncbi:MAG: GTP pyrophosphokinase [Deltaproteobacteria bacterium RIFCSPLOWO2_12_FULL_43_16]|nr:MAG: GTP pyrophosphokinase [Deltaproteobacteria bacterium GWA2_43_19]OGQ10176.1 MAG: GTP pyrophosphokinase [Deltaproteobacteria bacterium RIFCSPHIGHO2_02_FULL_43_33]OGQ58870.1 MAG: GTP pyrophosphokinase [Deltaproteobacteria bacterium RIFCSPLOWO2_12_FULL_43_16]
MVRLEDIVDKISSYNPTADIELIKRAYIFSAKVHQGQMRVSGEPYLNHIIEVAHILTDMQMDVVTVIAGILHDTVEDTLTTLDKIKELFGDEVATLVDGVTKIGKISFDRQGMSGEERQAENFRKMIIAMAQDIRVIMIKLADRLHNMRTLSVLSPEKRTKIAQETMDIYAPIANRLGIGWIKTELEDLAFNYLKPEPYKELQERLTTEKEERERYIHEVKAIIEKRLAEYNLKAEVTGRPKHLYSIHTKMLKDGLSFEHIYDILAFRIMVSTVKECYEALGIIHSTWKPIPGRFKDYIAIPKPNMYQSLHTSVIGPYGERMEIQIRTEEMHKIAEEGIAAHWRYKEGKAMLEKDDKRFAWLRQMLELQKDMRDAKEFMDTMKMDLFSEEVFVFTPKGTVKELPKGASPVDFAYAVHTDIGHRCSAAKVNGRLVPLKYQLKNGDTVEIITSPNHTPSKDWLKFVITSRAKARIRQWIKTEERERSIALGKEICDKDFKKHDVDFYKLLKSGELDKIAKEGLGFSSIDDALAGVGYGKLSSHQLLSKLLPPEKIQAHPEISAFKKVLQKFKKPTREAVLVKGIDDIMIRFARCCNPLQGDEIVGYISRGRGVAVHLKGCPSIKYSDSERLIDVAWDKGLKASRPAKLRVICHDEKGLLVNMSSVITAQEANIINATITTTPDRKAVCIFEIEVNSLDHLMSIINGLKKVKKVIKVERVKG